VLQPLSRNLKSHNSVKEHWSKTIDRAIVCFGGKAKRIIARALKVFLVLISSFYKKYGQVLAHFRVGEFEGVAMAKKTALFILPFDHRTSFEKDLFGICKRPPTPEESAEISDYKQIIYKGFELAVELGVAKEHAGILVDEEFGAKILVDAKAKGYLIACSVEKSGQSELEFAYGDEFADHILRIRPDFVKVLVRYNPEGDGQLNGRQASLLSKLSKFCDKNNLKLMIELLVPLTPGQTDPREKPKLMVAAIQQLQEKGAEPSIWKVEGCLAAEDCEKVTQQAQSAGRGQVKLIVLGGGQNTKLTKQMLISAAKVPGYIGFAIGRTIWEAALKKVREGHMLPSRASQEIAENFKSFCDLWNELRE
jgi:myo-inositol catabolism protein IolC